MAHFRSLARSVLVTLGVASSACLSDITWGDLPDAHAPPDDSSGGSAGAGSHVSAGAAGMAGSAIAGSAPTLPAMALDAGIPDGGTGAEGCDGSVPCLSAPAFPLPSPCAGVRYSAPLSITGGTPPFSWSLLAGSSPEFVLRESEPSGQAPASIESSSNAGPAHGGVVRVHVTDRSTPRQALDLELDLTLRDSCWFAYLSEDGPAQLHLRDVFLETDRVLGGTPDSSVLDFQFSPDGRWLAFRETTPGGDRLYTYSTRAPRSGPAQVIPFACALSESEAESEAGAGADAGATSGCGVLDYAWSPDSNHLAFVMSGSSRAQDSLSGVSGFATPGGPGEPWPARTTATWVNAEVPLDYSEQLGWLGSDRLVFLGDELGSDSTTLTLALYTATVDAAGPSDVEGLPPLLTAEGTTLRGGTDGLLLVESSEDSESSVISYYTPGEPTLYHSGWLSPSGAFVGAVTEDAALELYDVRDDEDPVASSGDGGSASGSCHSILAWSDPIGPAARERIACAVDAGLEFFEYDRGTARLAHLARVGASVASGARRAFSPDGRWFVFGNTSARFDLIDLEVPEPRLDVTPIQPLAAPVELLFPPARPGLVNLADVAGMAEYPLPGSTSWPSAFTSSGAAPRSSCVEAFWQAPGEWCGAPRAARHLAYAPDARSLLFEDAPGRLALAHPGTEPRVLPVTDALVSCTGACLARVYAFQP